jgi:hypothetical protein
MKICGLFLKNNFIAFCDASEAWQLGFQDPATPSAEGMIFFHNYLSIVLASNQKKVFFKVPIGLKPL